MAETSRTGFSGAPRYVPPPIELTVHPYRCPHGESFYRAVWPDGEPERSAVIPEVFLDLAPWLIARILLEQGYNPQRELLVRLHGGDRDLVRAPLGAVAATPLVNTAAPVSHPATAMVRPRHG
jgi:hypothetical protein